MHNEATRGGVALAGLSPTLTLALYAPGTTGDGENGVGPATSFTQTTSTSATPSGTSSYAVPTPTSGGEDLLHFSPQMWLTPVVDPDSFRSQGGSSPEGQAFVVEMYAAYRDWAALGSPGANAAGSLRLRGRGRSTVGRALLTAVVAVLLAFL